MDNKRRLFIQIGILLAVSALSVFTGSVFNKEIAKMLPDKRTSSTYNEKASGLSGLWELTEKLGYKTARWELPYRQLGGLNHTLVTISPPETLKEFEVEQILKWVKKGNTWIYFDDFSFFSASQILGKLKLTQKDVFGETVDKKGAKKNKNSLEDLDIVVESVYLRPKDSWSECAGVQGLKLEPTSRLSGGQAVVEDEKGQLITCVPLKKGRVLIGTPVSICENKTVARVEYWSNFQFMENWMSTGGGTIFFDERAHGYTGGTNVFIRLSRGPVGLVVGQLLIILIIGVASAFQRFGRPESVDTARRISNLEYINGLANTWSRAHANKLILEILFTSFKSRLSKVLGLPVYEENERFSTLLKERLQQARSQANEKVFEEYQEALEGSSVTDSQVSAIVSSCDKIGVDLGFGRVK